MSDIIYEKPRLNIFQKLNMLWREDETHPKGFTEEFRIEMEVKQNDERIPEPPREAAAVCEEAVAGAGQTISTSSGTEDNKEERELDVPPEPPSIPTSSKKETLSFYDFKGKKKFETNKYDIMEIKTKTGKTRRFAIAIAPSGCKASRAMKNEI